MLFHTRCPLLPPSLKARILLYSDIQAEVIPQSKEHVTSRLGIEEKTSAVIMEISMKGFGGKLKTEPPYDPAILFLGKSPKDSLIFIATLVTTTGK